MKKPIVRVFKEDDVEINLESVIDIFNRIAKSLEFIMGKNTYKIDTETINESESLEELKNMHINEIKNDLIVLFITNKPYEDNYFFHSIKNSSGKIYLLSLAYWDIYTTYSKNTGVFYYIIDLLSLYISKSTRHYDDGIKNCIYNFRNNKTEIHDGIHSALICDDCQDRILSIQNPSKNKILNDIIDLLEVVKRSNIHDDIVVYWNSKLKEKVKIFFSYAHEDRAYLNEFKDYIKIFERNGLVERWDDNELVVGEKWDNTIKDKIYSADIVIFLLSASSLASDYIYNHELKIAFELNDMDEVYVIPIIIKDCLWDMTGFSEFQILPIDGKAVNSWRLREEAWTATARGLKKAIDNIIILKESIVENNIITDTLSNKNKGLKSSVNESDISDNLVLKFLTTYRRWWFNIPRIINWGSEREGFNALQNLTEEELKSMLRELEDEDKIVSKSSSKNRDSFLYKAK